ncbi:MAG: hypothetical protein AABY84_05850 [Candidatus Firestonebacteria bacterium]
MKKFIIKLIILLLLSSLFNLLNPENIMCKQETNGNKYKIAFVMDKNIWIMNDDGSEKRQITKTNDVSILFGWFPDNKNLLYGVENIKSTIENCSNGYKLWILTVDENKVVKLAQEFNVFKINYFDNEMVIFTTIDSRVWSINMKKHQIKKIFDKNGTFQDLSPDKKRILYIDSPEISSVESNEIEIADPGIDIYWLDISNLNEKFLITSTFTNNALWLSNDKIIYSEMKGIYTDLSVVRIDTGEQQILKFKNFPLTNYDIKLSPKRDKIIGLWTTQEYIRYTQKDFLWVGKLKTKIGKTITRGIKNCINYWHSDNERIIYVSDRNGIWIVDYDGKNSKKLSDKGDYPCCSK